MALINAYRADNGAKVRIPEHWLDHKVLGKPFRKTPPSKAPTTSTTPAATVGVNQKKEA